MVQSRLRLVELLPDLGVLTSQGRLIHAVELEPYPLLGLLSGG